MKIALCTTCRGRVEHISHTLPQNLRDNPDATLVLLDYNDLNGLGAYVEQNHKSDLSSGHLVYYRNPEPARFQMAHAKNMAHRLGMREGADVIVTLDADNYTGSGFCNFIRDRFSREQNIFLCPQVVATGTGQVRIAPRGVAGRLAIRSHDFVKAGGYDEEYDTWRGEDVDLVARLRRMGYAPRFIDPMYLDAIRHGSGLRFKEYPHAAKYETDEEVRRINNSLHTVVNFGNFGCGVAYKNFSREPIVLRPVPTRVFGIGLHRTATTSLHEAFRHFGYSSFHWETGDKARHIWDEMNAPASSGKSRMLERYYALCDLPIPLLYKKLDASYPGSKFILTVRDEAGWLKSVERLWDRRYNPTRWEWDVYPFSNRIHRALYGQTDFDSNVFLERYRRHNAEVVEYFRGRSRDLLVMDMSKGAGWPELCRFLDAPVPPVSFPHSNHTKE